MASFFAKPKELPLNNYRLLGATGVRISPLGIGAMNFGGQWDAFMGACSKEEAFKILDEYVAAGGNFIDTADKYHEGKSEEWLGEWMKARGNRHEMVIATKYTNCMKVGSINSQGPHRKHMMEAVDASLKRLQTDFIDLYYVHFCDHTTPIEEILRNLQDLVHMGKVHYLGISDYPAWQVSSANTMAALRGWTPFSAYQGRFSLLDRDIERDVVPMCESFKLGLIPWGAVGAGKLTGKYKRGQEPPAADAVRGKSPFFTKMTEEEYKVVDVVEAIAQKHKATCSQIALAWVIANPNVPSALIGSRSLAQFKDNLGAMSIKLTAEDMQKLNEVSARDPGFPHSMVGFKVPVAIAASAGRIQLPPYV